LLPISSSDAEALGLFSWGLFTLFIGEGKEMSDVATSDSHLVPPTSDISFPSPINRVKRPHEKSPSASASEDEIGSKRLRRPTNHLKEFTSEKPW
jgi:hypothetical protein